MMNVLVVLTRLVAHYNDNGFGFVGDGDRVGVIDDKGNEIFADKIGLLIARNLSNKHKKSKKNKTSIFLFLHKIPNLLLSILHLRWIYLIRVAGFFLKLGGVLAVWSCTLLPKKVGLLRLELGPRINIRGGP